MNKDIQDYNDSHIQNHEMLVSMTVVPETEAEYIGGYPQMAKYLQENIIDKMTETVPA